MNKYKNLAAPDLTHPLSSLKQMTNVLTGNTSNNSALDPHAYLAAKYVRSFLLRRFASANEKPLGHTHRSHVRPTGSRCARHRVR
jgi:hypothetical protein